MLEAALAAARSRGEESRQQLADLLRGARPQEIEQAEAGVRDAEAVARRARTERDRQQQLFQERAVARRAVDDAEEALTRAEAGLQRARAALALVREGPRPGQVDAARARVQAADAEVRAASDRIEALATLRREEQERLAAVRMAEAMLQESRSARLRLQTLRRRLQAAEARTVQAEAGRRQAAAVRGERDLRASFAGVVGRRHVDPGDLAVPGTALFTVVEESRPWVEAELSEEDLAGVRPGDRATVTTPAHPGREFPGRVERVGAQAVPQIAETRTSARIVRVRISLDSVPLEQRRLLKPGMEVDVSGSAALVSRALLIPNDAVLIEAGGPQVFVVEGETAVKRPIRPGYANATETQVLSGLKVDEAVVVGGKDGLTEGARVRVRNAAR